MLVIVLPAVGFGARILAQSEDEVWATPVNLSQSGVASSPAIVLVPDGTLRIFWWDQFDGTMVADGILAAPTASETEVGQSEGELTTSGFAWAVWSATSRATIQIPGTVQREGREVEVFTPIQTVPKIVGDASGRAHAFWLGEPAADTGNTPLLYSRLNPGSTSWSTPSGLTASAGSFDVTADITGTVHLVYVQANPAPNLPVGLYYRQLPRGGAGWSTPLAVHRSQYLRLLPPDEERMRLTADGNGSLYAVWDDPHLNQVLQAYSSDGGETWSEPRPVTSDDMRPQFGQVIARPGGPETVLWEPTQGGSRTLAASSEGAGVTLARWDGERWSGSRRLTLHFADNESGQEVFLSSLQLAMIPVAGDEEAGAGILAVAGIDQRNDVWITAAEADVLERFLGTVNQEPSAEEPPVPLNLSRSGAASDPAIVARPDNTLLAFWWDRFDGLTMADGVVVASTVMSGTTEIPTSREIWSEPRAAPLPAATTPRMVADAAGRIHAFWLAGAGAQEVAEGEVAVQPLMHSQLGAGSTDWSSPSLLSESALAFDVAVDAAGTLHLAYTQNMHSQALPAGIYYRRGEHAGAQWTAATLLYPSRYLRLLALEDAHLRIAADEGGSVYVTWDDPQQEQLLLTHSGDGGATWGVPVAVDLADERPRRGRLIAVPGGETLLLWERTGAGGACSLVQAPAAEILDGDGLAGRQALEGLTACPENETFVPLGEGQVLMVAGSGSEALTLAAWTATAAGDEGQGQWSEPSRLSYSFDDPELSRGVYLAGLQATVVDLPLQAAEPWRGVALVAVGTDQDGDVWVTSSHMATLEVVFAPPPPWSAPVDISESEGYPALPAMTADTEGWLHLLWSEAAWPTEPGGDLFYARWDGERWTRPSSVLQSPEGGAAEPDLVAGGDRLYAVWSSQDGEILYSYAFGRDAYAAGGWSEPMLLSEEGAIANGPDIVADAAGGLHAVFAVPVNERRGIYYTRSNDGETWVPARQVLMQPGQAGLRRASRKWPRIPMASFM